MATSPSAIFSSAITAVRCAGAVAALIWLGTLSILAGQLIGIAAVLQVAGGWPPYAGYLVGALVAVTYFAAGGLLTTAWVNRVQLLFILAGFAVAMPAAVQARRRMEPGDRSSPARDSSAGTPSSAGATSSCSARLHRVSRASSESVWRAR